MTDLAVYGTHVNPRVGLEPLAGSQSLRRLEEVSGRAPLASWARLGNVWEPDEEYTIRTGPARLAASRALAVASEQGARRVVLLGAWAGTVLREQHGCWVTDCDVLATWWPHPSGLNRWWNDPRNVAESRRWWEQLASTVP